MDQMDLVHGQVDERSSRNPMADSLNAHYALLDLASSFQQAHADRPARQNLSTVAAIIETGGQPA